MIPSGDSSDAQAQVHQEVTKIVPVLSELTGLTSRWNGEVELAQDARAFGRKPFSCRIVLNERLAADPLRWRTLIHEALHSFSAGYNMTDYQAYRGWEEGVIEQLQRHFRPTVLQRLGISIAETVFQEQDEKHLFNQYLESLEELRFALSLPEEPYYLGLLETAISRRPGYVHDLGAQLSAYDQLGFRRLFAKHSATLRRSIVW